MGPLGGLRVVQGMLTISDNPMLCQSSVECVEQGVVVPAVHPARWNTEADRRVRR